MLAAAGSSVAPLVRGPVRPGAVLGVMRSALYVAVDDTVLAVVTPEAVRLPFAVVLAAPLDLRAVRPDGAVLVGDGAVSWTSGGSPVRVSVVREWRAPIVAAVVARPERLADLATAVAAADVGVPAGLAPAALLGRGPGLTPSGDDVLAGWLLGARAFGVEPPVMADPAGTTALSAALLRCAARGECVPQLAAVVRGLGAARPQPRAVAELLAVGHTSGAALALGLLRAAAGVPCARAA